MVFQVVIKLAGYLGGRPTFDVDEFPHGWSVGRVCVAFVVVFHIAPFKLNLFEIKNPGTVVRGGVCVCCDYAKTPENPGTTTRTIIAAACFITPTGYPHNTKLSTPICTLGLKALGHELWAMNKQETQPKPVRILAQLPLGWASTGMVASVIINPMQIFRATVFHTLKNAFKEPDALEHFADGAIVVNNEKIVAVGNWAEIQHQHPNATTTDLRPGILIPGMVDCHVHFPQVGVIGAMGLDLLDWLETRTLPLEAKMKDDVLARTTAKKFLNLLIRNGTTTALVFATHFANATNILFEEASAINFGLTSGLVVSDRMLRPELHVTPKQALQDSHELALRWHGKKNLRYAVTPRFSLSCSDAMLEVCGELLRQDPTYFFTSHINESLREIETVKKLFPWAEDYLETYEKFGLVGKQSVLAHSVHASDSELERMGDCGCAVAHCPSSNMFIGSGLMPLQKHLAANVRVALGSDVGGGTGLSLFKEGLQTYLMQMLQGFRMSPTQLLYMATLAGAEALGLEKNIGNFLPDKQADMVLIRPNPSSTLAATLEQCETPEQVLGAVFTLGTEAAVQQVWIAGHEMIPA